MAKAQDKVPLRDMEMFHRGYYNEFAQADIGDDIASYRNHLSSLFADQVIRRGKALAKNLSAMVVTRQRELEQFIEDFTRCKASQSHADAQILQLLQQSIRNDETRSGILPRTLEYYLSNGLPNIKRIECCMHELRRLFNNMAQKSAQMGSRK